MSTYAYSPMTGEIIITDTIADWMGQTSIKPPAYDKEMQSAFFVDGAWDVVDREIELDPVPDAVTRRQARLALFEVGELEAVENAVAQAGMEAQIEYDADTWERSNAFLQGLWAQLGGTEAELDDLFRLAATK